MSTEPRGQRNVMCHPVVQLCFRQNQSNITLTGSTEMEIYQESNTIPRNPTISLFLSIPKLNGDSELEVEPVEVLARHRPQPMTRLSKGVGRQLVYLYHSAVVCL